MNIVVCIKQVPDTTDVRINPETNTLVRDGVQSIINPFDMYAIEEGLRLKEKFDGSKVTVISMGPPQAETALREAIALGVDEAVLLSDSAFAGSDTLATSYALASGIKKIGNVDVIICGKQAIDGDTAQVGPGISVWLDLPQVTFVKKIEEVKEKDGKKIFRLQRMVEEGYEIIEVPLPCMITVVKEINEPRMPSLKGMMRSKKVEITKWTAEQIDADAKKIGLDGSPTQVVRIFTPPVRQGGQMLLGEPEEVAAKLKCLLKEFIN
ncbi:MAG: electron transfer flavoprotein subunit beta/FixA family protein [Candidatus Omnitrophica bacterium]|nr:electron transfer flavoprotein subunit beta/FixA family protein [Candidatus Omnitrophota bacterium]